MQKLKFTTWLVVVSAMVFAACSNPKSEKNQALINFDSNGYLDQSVISDIRKEHLRIKAISAFEYALPIVGVETWHQGFLKEAKVENLGKKSTFLSNKSVKTKIKVAFSLVFLPKVTKSGYLTPKK